MKILEEIYACLVIILIYLLKGYLFYWALLVPTFFSSSRFSNEKEKKKNQKFLFSSLIRIKSISPFYTP